MPSFGSKYIKIWLWFKKFILVNYTVLLHLAIKISVSYSTPFFSCCRALVGSQLFWEAELIWIFSIHFIFSWVKPFPILGNPWKYLWPKEKKKFLLLMKTWSKNHTMSVLLANRLRLEIRLRVSKCTFDMLSIQNLHFSIYFIFKRKIIETKSLTTCKLMIL